MIRPIDARVVVKKPTRQERTDSGIILPDTVEEGQQTAQGEVVAVGPGSRAVNGELMPMGINVGDRIIYGKFQGVEINHKGEELFVVMERDVIAVIDEE
tara:strand:+ start:61 stop:357 length:297 start_codon:yes stop_codon:yes gene_type:complete